MRTSARWSACKHNCTQCIRGHKRTCSLPAEPVGGPGTALGPPLLACRLALRDPGAGCALAVVVGGFNCFPLPPGSECVSAGCRAEEHTRDTRVRAATCIQHRHSRPQRAHSHVNAMCSACMLTCSGSVGSQPMSTASSGPVCPALAAGPAWPSAPSSWPQDGRPLTAGPVWVGADSVAPHPDEPSLFTLFLCAGFFCVGFWKGPPRTGAASASGKAMPSPSTSIYTHTHTYTHTLQKAQFWDGAALTAA